MSYAIMLPTVHGPLLVNRHDTFQAEALLRTGRPHIEAEIATVLQIVEFLRPDAVAIDAGANIGLIAIPLARRLAAGGGVVHAFEPQRLVHGMLLGNIALSGLLNLQGHRMALGQESGSIRVPCHDPYVPANTGGVSLREGVATGDDVPLARIDDFALDRVDLIKIDVEHMELDVLIGAAETIARDRPILWLEIWPEEYASVGAWLRNASYRLFVFDALNFLAMPVEQVGTIPVALPPFDGVANPHYEAIVNGSGQDHSNRALPGQNWANQSGVDQTEPGDAAV